MEKRNPWPTRENRKAPADVFGIIKDELRVNRDEDSFRESLVGLMRYYGETPLAKSLHERTNQIASLINIDDTPGRDVSKLIAYSGAIFGLHASVHHLPHAKKEYIAARRLPDVTQLFPYGSEGPEDFSQRYAQAYLDEIEETVERYRSLPNKHKDLLQRSAQFACAQYGEQFESLFICGAMTSIHYTVPLGDNYRPHSFAH